MKKNKRFLYDMENIPDRFLDEAENAPVVKKKIRWSTIISAAACLALICAVPAGVSKIIHSHNNISGSPEVTSETGEVTEISEVSGTELIPDISEEAAETEQEQSYRSVHITVEAGSNLWHTAQLLEENGVCNSERFIENFNRGSDEYAFISEVPVPDNNNKRFFRMEGYIMPGEYDFSVKENKDSEEYYNSISRVFYERTQKTLTKEMSNRASELGMTLDEVMTLASIVEQETGLDDLQLMKNFSSVFYNRLSKKNNYEFETLCSDPTREYGESIINYYFIYEDDLNKILKMTGSDQNRGYKETAVNQNIKNTEDLSEINLFLTYTGNAYDTFKTQGLPPGPICSPGESAVNAVLWPNDTDYLYFCINIENKETYFAKTLKEHEANLSITDNEIYEGTGMSNPWIDSDEAGVREATGFNLAAPPEAVNVAYSYMPDTGMAQMNYTQKNAMWVFRIQPTEALEDISGIYCKWNYTGKTKIAGMDAMEYNYASEPDGDYIDNMECTRVINWYDEQKKVTYSLSVIGTDLDGLDTTVYAENLYNLMK